MRSVGCARCCCTGPDNELKRLTPRNNDKLLFDGIPWVGRAQEEHDAFAAGAARPRRRGALPRRAARRDARVRGGPRPGDRRARCGTSTSATPCASTSPHGARATWTPATLAHTLCEGIRNDEVRGGFGLVTSLLAARRLPRRAAAEPAVHPRLQRVGPRPRDDHVAGDAGPGARDPADRADLHAAPALRRHPGHPRLAPRVRRGRRRAAALSRRGRDRRRRAHDPGRRRAAGPADVRARAWPRRCSPSRSRRSGRRCTSTPSARWSTSTRS